MESSSEHDVQDHDHANEEYDSNDEVEPDDHLHSQSDEDHLILSQTFRHLTEKTEALKARENSEWRELNKLTIALRSNYGNNEKLNDLLFFHGYDVKNQIWNYDHYIDVDALQQDFAHFYLEEESKKPRATSLLNQNQGSGNVEVIAFCPNILFDDSPTPFSEKPCSREFECAVLIADISGFSEFSGKMCLTGAKGLDVLHKVTNNFLGYLVQTVYGFEGDVISFAGDALICIFPVVNNEHHARGKSLEMACVQALSCAWSLRDHQEHSLSSHFGVSCGTIHMALVGGLDNQWVYIMNGACVTELHGCLNAADKREVVCTNRCFSLANSHYADLAGSEVGNLMRIDSLEGWAMFRKNARFRRSSNSPSKFGPVDAKKRLTRVVAVAAVKRYKEDHTVEKQLSSKDLLERRSLEPWSAHSLARTLPQSPDFDYRDDEIGVHVLAHWVHEARSFVPRPAVAAIDNGSLRRVSELRKITTMFLSVDSFDILSNTDPITLQPFALLLQEVLKETGGFLRQFLVDDKGCVAIAMWGVPMYIHTNDCSRGLYCAYSMSTRASKLGYRCSIGLTTGHAYCGIVGSGLRKDYVCIGDKVNVAARLMSKAKGKVLIDPDLYRQIDEEERLQLVPHIRQKLKGMSKPIIPFTFSQRVNPEVLLKKSKNFDIGNNTVLRRSTAESILQFLDILMRSGKARSFAFLGQEDPESEAKNNNSSRVGSVAERIIPEDCESAVLVGSLVGEIPEVPEDASFSESNRGCLTITEIEHASDSSKGDATASLIESEGSRDVVGASTVKAASGSSALEESRFDVDGETKRVTFQQHVSSYVESPVVYSEYQVSIASNIEDGTPSATSRLEEPTNADDQLPVIIMTGSHGCGKSTALRFLLRSAVRRRLDVAMVKCEAEDEGSRFSVMRKIFWQLADHAKADYIQAVYLSDGPSELMHDVNFNEEFLGGLMIDAKRDIAARRISFLSDGTTGPRYLHSLYSNVSTMLLSNDAADKKNKGAAGQRREANQQAPSEHISTEHISIVVITLFKLVIKKRKVVIAVDCAQYCDLGSWAIFQHLQTDPRGIDAGIVIAIQTIKSLSGASGTSIVSSAVPYCAATAEYKVLYHLQASSYHSVTGSFKQPLLSPIRKLDRALSEPEGTMQARKSLPPPNQEFVFAEDFKRGKQSFAKSARYMRMTKHPKTVTIGMGILSEDEVNEVLHQMLQVNDVPRRFARKIHAVTGGQAVWIKAIALFIKDHGSSDFLRSLDDKMNRNPSDDPLKDLIITRLDRLCPDELLVVKYASVIGERFSGPTLAAIIPSDIRHVLSQALSLLLHEGLIDVLEELPEPIFTFTNQLVQSTIYYMIPPSESSVIHSCVAKYIEQKFADYRHLFFSVLSHHYGRSRGNRPKAFKYTLKSADLAINSSMYQDGLSFLHRACDLSKFSTIEALRIKDIANRAIDKLEQEMALNKENFKFLDEFRSLKARIIKEVSNAVGASATISAATNNASSSQKMDGSAGTKTQPGTAFASLANLIIKSDLVDKDDSSDEDDRLIIRSTQTRFSGASIPDSPSKADSLENSVDMSPTASTQQVSDQLSAGSSSVEGGSPVRNIHVYFKDNPPRSSTSRDSVSSSMTEKPDDHLSIENCDVVQNKDVISPAANGLVNAADADAANSVPENTLTLSTFPERIEDLPDGNMCQISPREAVGSDKAEAAKVQDDSGRSFGGGVNTLDEEVESVDVCIIPGNRWLRREPTGQDDCLSGVGGEKDTDSSITDTQHSWIRRRKFVFPQRKRPSELELHDMAIRGSLDTDYDNADKLLSDMLLLPPLDRGVKGEYNAGEALEASRERGSKKKKSKKRSGDRESNARLNLIGEDGEDGYLSPVERSHVSSLLPNRMSLILLPVMVNTPGARRYIPGSHSTSKIRRNKRRTKLSTLSSIKLPNL